MKRLNISRLDEKRTSLHFEIGLAVALFLTLLGFNLEFEERKVLNEEPELIEEFWPDVIRTKVNETKIEMAAPPKPKPAIEIIPVENPPELPLDAIEKEDFKKNDNNPIVSRSEKAPPLPLPKKEDLSEIPLFRADQMPRFGDCGKEEGLSEIEIENCTNKALLEYIYSKLKYPELARQNEIEGKVVVGFVVSKSGELKEIQIIRDIGGGCGSAVSKILERMPNWEPGRQKGRKVDVRYNLPVTFRLN
ncbi:MAG: TonB family protein [Saprospiraceae bacterium]